MMEFEHKSSRGNALFLILIAVALFAALSYAITQGTRGGGSSINKENSLVLAGQVAEQPAAVRQTIARMVIGGTPINSIIFTTPAGDATDADNVFAPSGGAMSMIPPPTAACSPACTAWTYIPAASQTSGSYVYGVGSNETEALALLPSVTAEVCAQILKGMGFADTAPVLQTGAAFTGVAGAYDAAGSATTIKGAGTTLDGQEFSCWDNSLTADPTKYTYYHVLYAQ